MKASRKVFLISLLALLAAFSGMSQTSKFGAPFIQYFNSQDYGMHPRNYAIAQGLNGLIYIGNEYGVVEYDGYSWQQIHLPNGINATAIEVDPFGRIWVGSEEGIGYLEMNNRTGWKYHSQKLPYEVASPFTVSKILRLGKSMVFVTASKIFRSKEDGSLEVFFDGEDQNIQFATVLNQRLLVKLSKGQLLALNTDGPHHSFLDDLSYELVGLFTVSAGTLVVTAKNGLWLLSGEEMVPFETDFHALLSKDRISSATQLTNGNIVIGSHKKGVFVLDDSGHLVHHLTKDKGLRSDNVNALFESSDQNLWVALDNGLAYVELNSAFSRYDESLGFRGMVYATAIFQGRLYVGTTQGLYVAEWSEATRNGNFRFAPVRGIEGQVWALHNSGDQLLCGHETGVFEIVANRAVRRSNSSRVWTFVPSEISPGRMFVGTLNGIEVFERRKDNYLYSHRVEGFQESSRILAEGEGGNVWVCHGNKGLYNVQLSKNAQEAASVSLLEPNDSQAGLWFTSVTRSRKNGILFSSNQGIFTFDALQKDFIPFGESSAIPRDRFVNGVMEDQFGDLWVMMEGGLMLMKLQDDGSYEVLDEHYFSKVRGTMIGSYEHINVLDPRNVLIAAQDGVLHLDPTFFRRQHLNTAEKAYPTLIRSVALTEKSDSVIYSEAYNAQGGAGEIVTKNMPVIELPYSHNSVKFSHAVPYFLKDRGQQYQYLLEKEGFDFNEPEWSSWSQANQKEYTNLREGTYTFKVRGGKGSQYLNEEAHFVFVILPPWYRSGGAYVAYTLLAFGMLIGLIKAVGLRHEREKKQLRLAAENEMRQRQLVLEKERVELKNASLAEEIAFKDKELGTVVMQITQKNEFLLQLKGDLKQVAKSADGNVRADLQSSIREIERDMRLDKNWEKFQYYFDQVHQDFLERLSAAYPQLTSNTLKLCAFIRIGLSTKEIASLMNISLSGVEKRRYRLRKTMELGAEVNLSSFLKGF
jgi:ligand-binding sensor domain-containing protein